LRKLGLASFDKKMSSGNEAESSQLEDGRTAPLGEGAGVFQEPIVFVDGNTGWIVPSKFPGFV
jgi:hypothetical protein